MILKERRQICVLVTMSELIKWLQLDRKRIYSENNKKKEIRKNMILNIPCGNLYSIYGTHDMCVYSLYYAMALLLMTGTHKPVI